MIAKQMFEMFSNLKFESFDLYTSTSNSISMLVEDSTRRVGYKYTCRLNAKEFKCKHSLGVAILRGMLVPSPEAKCQQLARLRRKGRKAAAPKTLVYLPFDIRTPEAHPQEDRDLLLSLNQDAFVGDIANGY